MPNKFYVPLFLLISLVLSGLSLYSQRENLDAYVSYIIEYREKKLSSVEPSRIPTLEPLEIKITPPISVIPSQSSHKKVTIPQDNTEWGKARQVDDVTYTIKVGLDDAMGTPQEILDALNSYRAVNHSGNLAFDDKLNQYAQSRADYFKSIGTTDKHAQFNKFLEEENGFQTLGFRRVGENSYFGGKLNGVHLIEWVFSQSPGHNSNQLDPGWSYVGIGVTDISVDIVFATDRI